MRYYADENNAIRPLKSPEPPATPSVTVAWIDSLTRHDFENGAVLDEIRRALRRLEWLEKNR